jgi:hypothetical protein
MRLVHLDAALVEYPIMHLVTLAFPLGRFQLLLLLLSFAVFTFPQKVFLVEPLDEKLKLFLIFFLEVGEWVLTSFENVIQGFQLVVLTLRCRVGCLMVLAACKRMLLRLLPIWSLYLFSLLLYGSSAYRWVGAGRCKE